MRTKHNGMSLIELMIVVMIIGILAAIAYPNYSKYVTRGKRAEAKSRLLEIAQLQERWYTQNNTYTANLVTLLGLPSGTAIVYSDSNNDASAAYQITIVAGASGIGSSYTLTASPQGSQTNDAECASLTLTHTGLKGITGTGTTANCWKK